MRQLVIKPEQCIGCRSCELACALHRSGAIDLEQSAVTVYESERAVYTVPVMCMNCDDPTCAKVCPVEALKRNPETGAVEWNNARCIRCGSCIAACPLGNLHFDTLKQCLTKCNLCSGQPSCVKVCPVAAVEYFGGAGRNTGAGSFAEPETNTGKGGASMNGWIGRILRVDLTSGAVYKEELNQTYAVHTLGQRGLALRYCLEASGRFVLMTGPLTGLLGACTNQFSAAFCTPAHNRVAAVSAGGHLGPELKLAGYDGMILEGVCEQPSYLTICNGQVELLSAEEIWGKGVRDTTAYLLSHTCRQARVLCIGTAGERRSPWPRLSVRRILAWAVVLVQCWEAWA